MARKHSIRLDHGGLSTKLPSEYNSWREVLSRCLDPNNTGWHNYGGRGIKVCKRWRISFANFVSDMGPKPHKRCYIDRIDNDGHYTPGNCRWLTPKQSARNRRTNRLITHNGRSMCIAEWAELLGVSKQLIYERLKRGMSVEETLESPIMDKSKISHCHVAKRFTHLGTTKTVAQWARDLGISYFTVHRRITVYNWPVEKALFTPARVWRPQNR